MKNKFSTNWKASRQPRKQRKYLAMAPLHIKRKNLSVNLSEDLRKKHGRRNIVVRKGDTVMITRGKFLKKKGKVLEVDVKRTRVLMEGIQVKKRDGSVVGVFLKPAILQIVELNLDDKRRISEKNQEQPVQSKTKTGENKK